jgi:ubiquinone/menaquinone biosynthesis C-methylase UbiE
MGDGGARVDSMPTATKLQTYYAATAEQYDAMHAGELEHETALGLVAAFIARLQPRSLLDVGCGTGRALSYFREEFPDLTLRGTDPSQEMLQIAVEKNGIPVEWLDVNGDRLPYEDAAFDVAVATGVLHHVASPDMLISEMLRVTRSAIFISDGNKYGTKSSAMACIKVAARALGVIRQLEWIRHGGRHWTYSVGDGLAYPFSVFDHIDQLRRECASIYIIPTKGRANMLSWPLLHASHALVCALKTPLV